MEEIFDIYNKIKPDIDNAVKRFKEIGESSDLRRIFEELCFCLLTPQSKARMAEKIMNIITGNGSLYTGNLDDSEFTESFRYVRFKNNKVKYIILFRKMIFDEKYPILDIIKEESFVSREKLVSDIKGLGYKEASHFLRNIGKGDSLAILDRHILKNMVKLGIVSEIPSGISKNKYLELEGKLLEFSSKIGIPPDHLDFVLWYKEAGEVFK